MGDGKAGSAEKHRYAAATSEMRQFLDGVVRDHPRVHVIGPVRHAARYNRAVAELVERVDVTGFLAIVDDQHLVHVSRRHGDARREMQRGQLPVGRDDYVLLPRIFGDPDKVEPGTAIRRGSNSIVIMKVIGNVQYRVFAEVRVARRHLAFATMYKSRAG